MIIGTCVRIDGTYNIAAWLSRRETHLARNALLYVLLAAFEQRQVRSHLVEIRKLQPLPMLPTVPIAEPEAPDLAA